jgi:hypothetical protein
MTHYTRTVLISLFGTTTPTEEQKRNFLNAPKAQVVKVVEQRFQGYSTLNIVAMEDYGETKTYTGTTFHQEPHGASRCQTGRWTITGSERHDVELKPVHQARCRDFRGLAARALKAGPRQ